MPAQPRRESSLRARPRRLGVPAGLGSLALAALVGTACGSRGPLDDTPFAAPDASVDAAPTAAPSAPPAIPEAGPPVPIGPDLPPIVDCGLCLAQQCGQPILGCVTDPSCQRAFQCVLSTCGGKFDPTCVLQCAKTEPQGALKLLSIFGCITGQCGEDCTDILSQLGGGIPGIPGTPGTPVDAGRRDGGGRDGGPSFAPDTPATPEHGREALERAFSAWPELVTPARTP